MDSRDAAAPPPLLIRDFVGASQRILRDLDYFIGRAAMLVDDLRLVFAAGATIASHYG